MILTERYWRRNQQQPDLFAWAERRERSALSWPARRLLVRYGLSPTVARCIAAELHGVGP